VFSGKVNDTEVGLLSSSVVPQQRKHSAPEKSLKYDKKSARNIFGLFSFGKKTK